MPILSKSTKSLCLLIIFMMSIVIHCVNSKWFSHELSHGLSQHSQQAIHEADNHSFWESFLDHAHEFSLSHNQDNIKTKPLTDLEHRLFHVTESLYCALLAVALLSVFWRPSLPILSRWSFLSVLPIVDLELPFRPPQLSISI